MTQLIESLTAKGYYQSALLPLSKKKHRTYIQKNIFFILLTLCIVEGLFDIDSIISKDMGQIIQV